MSTTSRLQWTTAELVRGRKLRAMGYAAGQSMVLGAMLPTRVVDIASSQIDLKVSILRCPWIIFQVSFVSGTSFDLWTGNPAYERRAGLPGLTSGTPSWYRYDARSEVGLTDWIFRIKAGSGTQELSDLIVVGLPDMDWPMRHDTLFADLP